jgi:hypothetical protein
MITLVSDVVTSGTAAIHADGNFVLQQQAGEGIAGELTALIGLQDLRFAMPGK